MKLFKSFQAFSRSSIRNSAQHLARLGCECWVGVWSMIPLPASRRAEGGSEERWKKVGCLWLIWHHIIAQLLYREFRRMWIRKWQVVFFSPLAEKKNVNQNACLHYLSLYIILQACACEWAWRVNITWSNAGSNPNLRESFSFTRTVTCCVYKGTTLTDGPAYNLVNLIHPKLVRKMN